jgi:neutral ceramidase
MRSNLVAVIVFGLGLGRFAAMGPAWAAELRVGASAVEVEADDTMPIAGGIHSGQSKGQEGKLRATAVVVEKPGSSPVAIVSCDVLFVTRDFVDPALAEIEKSCGIPASHVLVHATHTHHAPSCAPVHAYGRCDLFVDRLKRAIVQSVLEARSQMAEASFAFAMGREATVGMNSRLRLKDGTIYWVGPRDDAVGPTGPFDPDLPVLVFRDPNGKLRAMLFGHSSHTIGALTPGARSPAFYGLAAQEIESELGGKVAFLEGASGSTHVYNMDAREAFRRIKQAVLETLSQAGPLEVGRVESLKRPFHFKVRTFDEAAEEKAVVDYCLKRIGPQHGESVAKVFRDMRKQLAPQQGQQRTTWIQAMVIGDVALVGVPAEFFTKLGIDIKQRSPFKHTVVAELSNDWIGYLPDREAHKLGGYQVWTGFHSYAEPGTGERMVDEVVAMLKELASRNGPR